MKTILLAFLASFLLVPGVLACGEKDIQFVDSIQDGNFVMEKSACTKNYFPSDGDSFLFEKDKIRVTDHQAKHILEDYLLQEYGPESKVTTQDVQIPGHENHGHGHGNAQLSHGHYSWSFNVIIPGMMDEKAFPMFVDMESGVVYGMGCGLGAGNVVFTPDLSQYPDSDQSDTDYHLDDESYESDERESITLWDFILGLFGFR